MWTLTKNRQIYFVIILTILTTIILFYLNGKSQSFRIKLIPIDQLPYYVEFKPHKLLNISFHYTLNSNVCDTTENIAAVFIVTSYFGNVETRSAMRRAFNAQYLEKHNLRRVFLLGEAVKDKYTTQRSISNENQQFGDIVQGNFSEAYRNLTYKHVMGLKWVGTYCPKAKYVIKMDDDSVINMFRLNVILNSLENLGNRSFIAGYKLAKMKPIREPANKWYVTQQEYSASNYPTFVSGWFYITNPQTAMKLATLANYENYFWIDDVFVTGILANKLKIILFDISKYFIVNSEFLQCCLQDFRKNIDCDIYVGPNGGDPNMFFKFNEEAKKCSLPNKKCSRRLKPLNETCVAERKINLGQGDAAVNDFRLS